MKCEGVKCEGVKCEVVRWEGVKCSYGLHYSTERRDRHCSGLHTD